MAEQQVLKSVNGNFAIELARSPTNVTLLHFREGPFKVETFQLSREFERTWIPQPEIEVQYLARRWWSAPLAPLHGSEEALAAIQALAGGQDVESRKAKKTERQQERSETPSAKARAILKKFDATDKKQSSAFYDACEAEGIDRKLAASVLCIERKRYK
jgi:hypothetical protein